MGSNDKRKQSLYFPDDLLKEIRAEAARQDRSLSWMVQKAWRLARKEIMNLPSVSEPLEDEAIHSMSTPVPIGRLALIKKEGVKP